MARTNSGEVRGGVSVYRACDAQANVADDQVEEDTTVATNPGESRKQPSRVLTPEMSSFRKSDSSIPATKRQRRTSFSTSLIGRSVLNRHVRERMPPLLVFGILKFDVLPSRGELCEVLHDRLLQIPRFRSRLLSDGSSCYLFEELPEMVLASDEFWSYHLQEIPQKAPWGSQEMNEFVCSLFEDANGQDMESPLWRVFLVPKLDDGRGAIIACIDHTVGDGISLIESLFLLLDKRDEGFAAEQNSAQKFPERRAQPGLGPISKVLVFCHGVLLSLARPILPGDAKNRLKLPDITSPGRRKALYATPKLELKRFMDIKRKFEGATLNDILLALMTITFRRYYEETGDPIMQTSRNVSCTFPISTRPRGTNVVLDAIGNSFLLGSFSFPIHNPDRFSLVWQVKQRCNEIKNSPEPLLSFLLLRVMFFTLPATMVTYMVLRMYGKTTATLSNVPGPPTEAMLCGRPLKDISFYAFPPIGLYFGILTYNGSLSANIMIDSSCEGCDPEVLGKHWNQEFEAFYEEAMAQPGTIKQPTQRDETRMCLCVIFAIAAAGAALIYYYLKK